MQTSETGAKEAMEKDMPQGHLPERTPDADALSWCDSGPSPTLWDWIQSIALMTALYVAMILAVGLLTFLLLTVVVLLKGESWIEMALSWLDPELGLGALAIALAMAALPMLAVFVFRHVTAFRFDAVAQQLVITSRRAWLRPLERSWPFADIDGVYPFSSKSSASSTGLRVVLRNAKGKEFTRYLSEGSSEYLLEQQASWLKLHLGERVHVLVVYEGD